MASTRPPRPDQNNGDKKKPVPVASAPTNKPSASATKPTTPPPGRPGSAAIRRPNSSSKKYAPPPKKSNLPMLLIGGILLVVAIVVVAIIVLSGSKTTTTTANSTDSQGIAISPDPNAKVDSFATQGNAHIAVGASHVIYNSDPPTSGPHYATPAQWGIYDKPLADEYLIHNLEHGGIVIQYVCNGNCSDVINQLSVYARRYDRGVFTGILLAPRNSLPNDAKIAVTAWQKLLLMKSLDTKRLDEFIAAYFNKGPESAG